MWTTLDYARLKAERDILKEENDRLHVLVGFATGMAFAETAEGFTLAREKFRKAIDKDTSHGASVPSQSSQA